MNDRGFSTEYRANSTWFIYPCCTAPLLFFVFFLRLPDLSKEQPVELNGEMYFLHLLPTFFVFYVVFCRHKCAHTKKFVTIKALEYSIHKGIIFSLARCVLHMFGIDGENRWAAPQGQKDLDVGEEGGGEKTKKKQQQRWQIMHTLLLLFLCMQKFVPKGSDSECWGAEKLCLVSSDVCYGAQATIVVPSAYAPGLYIHVCKGYCLLLAQHCVRQTKRTCIKGLDSSSLFMWKWIPFPKGTKTAFTQGLSS